MRIAIIGPGAMPIPPTGWGAVEILIHDLRCELEAAGHTVEVINTPKKHDIIRQTNASQFDFVHVQYDDHVDVIPHLNCKNIGITSHYAYLEQPNKWGGYAGIAQAFLQTKAHILALSHGIANTYVRFGFDPKRIHVIHNGVRDGLFRYDVTCKMPDRSIYLAKVDYRKRQHLFQGISGLYFAGNIADQRFDSTDKSYLGEWSKQQLYQNLTEYANLVLLSDGEAHPLVCMEAMSAGLGLVVSQFACANLDLTKPFIDVIPEDRILDKHFVENVIRQNAAKSVTMRREIKEYARSFSWSEVTKRVYVPTYEKIILQESL